MRIRSVDLFHIIEPIEVFITLYQDQSHLVKEYKHSLSARNSVIFIGRDKVTLLHTYSMDGGQNIATLIHQQTKIKAEGNNSY